MSSLLWIILIVCSTVVIEGRATSSDAKFEAEDFYKIEDKIKKREDCRIRPGQLWCPKRREMVLDLFNAMPPDQHVKTYALPKRANLLEDEEKRSNGCKLHPGSLWCDGKRDITAPKLAMEEDNFAKFKDKLKKRACRVRPGSLWCEGKREIEEVPETGEAANE